MLSLDVPTLQITTALIIAGSLFALAALWRTEHHTKGSGYWFISMLLMGPSFLLIGLRGTIPDYLSIFIANLLMITGLVACQKGLRIFVGKKSLPLIDFGLPALVAALFFYYTFIELNMGIRTIVISLAVVVVCSVSVLTLLQEKSAPWRSAGVAVATVLIFLGLSMLVRLPPILLDISNYSFKSATMAPPLFLFLIFIIGSLTLTLIMLSYASLESEYRLFTSAVFQSASSIIITDSNGFIQYVNPAYRKRTGFTLMELTGKDYRIFDGMEPKESEEIWKLAATGKNWRGEVQNQTKKGELFWEIASISSVKRKQKITNFVIVKEDITRLKEAEKQIIHLANHDALTGLPSLRLAKDRMFSAIAIAKRNKSKTAIMFIDLDGFKAINDAYGHNAGDEVLKEVSQRLISCIREADTVARIGGDEFMIVLTDIKHQSDTSRVAENVLHVLAQSIETGACSVTVGASIGIAVYPDNGCEPDDLLKSADEAMYRVKRKGKNNYQHANECAA